MAAAGAVAAEVMRLSGATKPGGALMGKAGVIMVR